MGYQLVVDLDGDGDNDGILVGESVYQDSTGNTIRWLGGYRVFSASIPAGTTPPAPSRGTGSAFDGTLDSNAPVFKNRGECVSSSASGRGDPTLG